MYKKQDKQGIDWKNLNIRISYYNIIHRILK